MYLTDSNSEPTKTASTIGAYRREGKRLFEASKAPDDACCTIRLKYTAKWFSEQDRRWSKATIRVYRAALKQMLEDFSNAIPLDEETQSYIEACLSTNLMPREAAKAARTSARKRKTVSESEIEELTGFLRGRSGKTDKILASLLDIGVFVGWRPSEALLGLKLDGNVVVVPSCKTTNGRGIGETRRVTILCEKLKSQIAELIDDLDVIMSEDVAVATVRERFSKALTRACKACGIKPITLYTLRHQAIATNKVKLQPNETAAIAGHASANTATHHYAKRRSGWKVSNKVAAEPAQLQLVRRDLRQYEPPSFENSPFCPG
ncbi:MAG: hypothetical protein ACXIVD_02955 [Salinarimonas sp.]